MPNVRTPKNQRRRREEQAPEGGASSELPENRRRPSGDVREAEDARRKKRRLVVVAGAVVAAVVGGYALDHARYAGRIARGVSIGGVPVAGMTIAEAREALARQGQSRLERPLTVVVRASQFELTPAEIGGVVDIEPAVERAVEIGRAGSALARPARWVATLWGETDVPLTARVEAASLAPHFDAFEREAIDDGPFLGAVVVSGDEPAADYPRPGWVIDRPTSVERIEAALAAISDEPVELPLVRQVPPVAAAAIDLLVVEARTLTSAPVVLEETPASFEARTADLEAGAPPKKPPQKKGKPEKDAPPEGPGGPRPWRLELSRADLLGALRSRAVPQAEPRVELYFDARAFKPRLDAFSSELEEPAIDAKFVVDAAGALSITPSRSGTRVDGDAVATAALAAARDPQRLGALPVARGAEPSFTEEDARALGIVGLVSQFTTRHPCCQPRVKNIHHIADMLDGTIVRPGETLSVNELVGPRTVAKGFVEAPSIEDGEMVDTVGGGISQFATTLFNAVLEGGYDIVERQPHSFYFHRYPIGHEATLSYPKPDLIFKNDTEAGMLILCDYDKTWIRVRILGDNGGRKVEKKTSQIFDLTEPDVEYEADDTMSPDDEDVKDKGTEGWSVSVTRIVTFPDGTTKEESRKVTYKPKVRVVAVHSCRIPKKKKGYTGEPCPEPVEEEGEGGESSGETAGQAPETEPTPN